MEVKKLANVFQKQLETIDFFANIYQKQVHCFQAKETPFATLFDERDLMAALQFLPEDSKSLKLIFNGFNIDQSKLWKDGILDLNKLWKFHSGGSTIIFNRLHLHSNKLLYFMKKLEGIFSCELHANFYGTPHSSKGFKPHRDVHDVFAMQLKGTKKWTFYETTDKNDLNSSKTYPQGGLEQKKTTELQQGDYLYVPRGEVHAAESDKKVSWHLTMGLTSYYWSNLLKDTIDSIALHDQKFKEVVPVNTASMESIDQQLKELFETVKEKATSIQKAEKLDQYRSSKWGKEIEKIEVPSIKLLNQLNLTMSFQLNSKSKLKITYHQKAVYFHLPYRESDLSVNKRLKPTIQYVQKQKQFKIKEIPFLRNEEEQLLLAYYLWNNGIIQPINI